jgi:hypothetical protein
MATDQHAGRPVTPPIWIDLDLAPCLLPHRGDTSITSTKKPPSWQLDGF